MTVETPAALLRRAAETLAEDGAGQADLIAEYPDVDACVADLMRKHALLLDHGGSYADTRRLLTLAQQILGEQS